MPRKYRMIARAAAVEETRRRIVEASMVLHARQGILATSYDEIARQAGTAPATVYRHFPSLDNLVRACANTIVVLRPLTPKQAAQTFGNTTRLAARLDLLVHGTFECYERDQGWLHAAYREEDLLPALQEAVRILRENLRMLVATALEGRGASERTLSFLAGLVSFPVWEALRKTGLTPEDVADEVLSLARYHLTREGIL